MPNYGPIEIETAVAHTKNFRRASAGELDQSAACHAARRCGHHRSRGRARRRSKAAHRLQEGVKSHAAGVHHQGLHSGAAKISNASIPRSMRSGENSRVQEVFQHRIRRRHAQWFGGAGHRDAERLNIYQIARALGGAVEKLASRQAESCRHAGRILSPSRVWAASAVRRLRPSSTRPKSAILGVSKSSFEAGVRRTALSSRV